MNIIRPKKEQPQTLEEAWDHLVHHDKPFCGEISMGNGTPKTIAMFVTAEGGLFVGIVGHGCQEFTGHVGPLQIGEVLNYHAIADCMVIADMINAQMQYLEMIDMNRPPMGHYNKQFTQEGDRV